MPLTKNELPLLPLYLTGNYIFYGGSTIDQKIIWAKLKPDGSYTPEHIKKQGQQLKQFLSFPIVFVFDEIESWKRKRLML